MKLNRSKKGFTLVEIMIVVVIIGLLAAMAIPAFQKVRRNTIGKTIINDARQIGSALAQIATEYGATGSGAAPDTIVLNYDAATGRLDNNAPQALANGRIIPANEIGKYFKSIGKNYTLSGTYAFGAGESTTTTADDTAFTISHGQVSPIELQAGLTSLVPGNNSATMGNPIAFDVEGKLL